MCYFITLATPLTLSEVRSMLPPGLAAQPAGAFETGAARRLLRETQTVVSLLVGGCSCDLVRERHPEVREDERHLRGRFARLGASREEIIHRLERHRRRPAAGTGPWGGRLAEFVAEHARNAGPSLYALRFGEAAPPFPAGTDPVIRAVAQVTARTEDWLGESRPTLVVR